MAFQFGKKELVLEVTLVTMAMSALGCSSPAPATPAAPSPTRIPISSPMESSSIGPSIEWIKDDPIKTFDQITPVSKKNYIQNIIGAADIKIVDARQFPDTDWGSVLREEPTLRQELPDFALLFRQAGAALKVTTLDNYFIVTPQPGNKLQLKYGDYQQVKQREDTVVTVDGNAFLLFHSRSIGLIPGISAPGTSHKVYAGKYTADKGWEFQAVAYWASRPDIDVSDTQILATEPIKSKESQTADLKLTKETYYQVVGTNIFTDARWTPLTTEGLDKLGIVGAFQNGDGSYLSVIVQGKKQLSLRHLNGVKFDMDLWTTATQPGKIATWEEAPTIDFAEKNILLNQVDGVNKKIIGVRFQNNEWQVATDLETK